MTRVSGGHDIHPGLALTVRLNLTAASNSGTTNTTSLPFNAQGEAGFVGALGSDKTEAHIYSSQENLIAVPEFEEIRSCLRTAIRTSVMPSVGLKASPQRGTEDLSNALAERNLGTLRAPTADYDHSLSPLPGDDGRLVTE